MPAQARRQAIIDAAVETFSSRPADSVSLEDVAESAGISKALIYEHFASKGELYDAMLRTSHDSLVASVLAAIAETDGPEERMRVGTEAFLAFVEDNRDAWHVIFRNATNPEIAPTLQSIQNEARVITAALVSDYAPDESPVEGVAMEVAIEMFAQQLVGATQALANWWDEHRDVSRADVLQAHMDFAWLGLERIAAGERWER